MPRVTVRIIFISLISIIDGDQNNSITAKNVNANQNDINLINNRIIRRRKMKMPASSTIINISFIVKPKKVNVSNKNNNIEYTMLLLKNNCFDTHNYNKYYC